jgi:hypothetical protein
MRVQISPEAVAFVRAHGGALWVWAARPRLCCASAPSWMHAAVQAPQHATPAFRRIPADGLDLWFRAPAGRLPDSLEIAVRGKQRPRLEAYWDGCLFALDA